MNEIGHWQLVQMTLPVKRPLYILQGVGNPSYDVAYVGNSLTAIIQTLLLTVYTESLNQVTNYC